MTELVEQVPLQCSLDSGVDAAWLIDDVLESARLQAKDLLRPYLNNQAYYQVDTPAIPQSDRWEHNFEDGCGPEGAAL